MQQRLVAANAEMENLRKQANRAETSRMEAEKKMQLISQQTNKTQAVIDELNAFRIKILLYSSDLIINPASSFLLA